MKRINKWRLRLKCRLGFRRSYLAIISVMDIVYGLALILADQTHVHTWWPVTVTGSILHLSLDDWGYVWIAFGVIIITGLFTHHDRYQFAAAVFLKSAWATLAFVWALQDITAGLWGVASIYIAWAIVTLLVAAWPEPWDTIKKADDE